MSSEQVAGILRQCSQQVRIVVARSVREPTSTTSTKISDITNSTSVLMSERISLTENTINKEISTNADVLSSANCYPAAITDQDGIINASKNKILLRTELLLENNHNLEKILENLQEQVCCASFDSIWFMWIEIKRTYNDYSELGQLHIGSAILTLSPIYFSLLFVIFFFFFSSISRASVSASIL